jgi:signal transduction histidine kinase
MLIGGITYFVLAKFGMALFSLQPSNITLLWLPSGIGLLMCLSGGKRALPFVFAASFASNFHGMTLPSLGMQLLHTAVAAGADAFAAWFAAFMLRRHLPEGLARPLDLIPFAFFVCIIPTLASATLLAGNLAMGGYIPLATTVDFVLMLLIADSLGILLCYPMLALWDERHRISRAGIMMWLLHTAALMAIVHLAFTWQPALIFLLIPAFLYMVFSQHRTGEHASLALAVCLIVAEASRNLGPFQVNNPEHGRMMLVLFLFSLAMTVTGMRLQQRLIVAKQSQVEAQNAQLSKAKEAAETANMAKSNFLANMSHEMRTPLHQITGLASIVRSEPLSEKQGRRMDMLDTATRRLTNIVETILELTRIESMNFDQADDSLMVTEILEDAMAGIRDLAAEKQIVLNVDNAVPERRLRGDRAYIQRALSNYAANAATYTNAGSITFKARIDADDGDSLLLRFEVEDSGIGIAPEDLQRLFTVFEQADNSSTRPHGGLGVGLAITQKIARRMGGDAGCDSAPGQGSTFWFTVRVRTPAV